MPSQEPFLEDSASPSSKGPATPSSAARSQARGHSHAHAHHDYENPWESAANDRLWDAPSPMETSTTALLNGDTNYHHHRLDDDSSSSSCSSQCFQMIHVLDILAGTGLVLYVVLVLHASEINKGKPQLEKIIAILDLSLGCLWIVRGVLAKVTQCGVRLSAMISSGLAVFYLIFALITWIMALTQKDNGKGGNGHNCPFSSSHAEDCFYLDAAPLVFLVLFLALVETVRTLWIRKWMQQEATMERDILNQSEAVSSPHHQHHRHHPNTPSSRRNSSSTPWWWSTTTSTGSGNPTSTTQRRSSWLTSPLLQHRGRGRPHWSSEGEHDDSTNYYMDSGVGTPPPPARRTRSWWPFSISSSSSSRRRGYGGDDGNLRDDGSVEYASLNEDWASRSQEDPFWWADDESSNNHNHNHNTGGGTPATREG